MLIVANWKAYVEERERVKKLYALAKRLTSARKVAIILAPSAPQLGFLAPRNTSKVAFAAQDISLTTGGPHTGEVTAAAFAALGATYTIVGHSERRAKGETRETTAQKVAHAVATGPSPMSVPTSRAHLSRLPPKSGHGSLSPTSPYGRLTRPSTTLFRSPILPRWRSTSARSLPSSRRRKRQQRRPSCTAARSSPRISAVLLPAPTSTAFSSDTPLLTRGCSLRSSR